MNKIINSVLLKYKPFVAPALTLFVAFSFRKPMNLGRASNHGDGEGLDSTRFLLGQMVLSENILSVEGALPRYHHAAARMPRSDQNMSAPSNKANQAPNGIMQGQRAYSRVLF